MVRNILKNKSNERWDQPYRILKDMKVHIYLQINEIKCEAWKEIPQHIGHDKIDIQISDEIYSVNGVEITGEPTEKNN